MSFLFVKLLGDGKFLTDKEIYCSVYGQIFLYKILKRQMIVLEKKVYLFPCQPD